MKVLITGGLGFIGQALIERLLANGHSLRILDNMTNPSISVSEVEALGVEVFEGDIRERKDCESAVKGIEAVVHLAAQTNVLHSVEKPMEDLEINGLGLLNVLDALKQAGGTTFVFSSSNAMVGIKSPPMSEDMLPAPLAPYGCTKLLGESYCHAYHALYGMQTVCLRFANVYGPGSMKKGSVVAKMIKTALDEEPLIVYGDGNQTRDFIYIDDIVSALVGSLEAPRGGEVFCVGTGRETTVNEMVASLKKIMEPDLKRTIPVRYEPARNGEIERNFSDISKAARLLSFKPDTQLHDGLVSTWKWFKDQM